MKQDLLLVQQTWDQTVRAHDMKFLNKLIPEHFYCLFHSLQERIDKAD